MKIPILAVSILVFSSCSSGYTAEDFVIPDEPIVTSNESEIKTKTIPAEFHLDVPFTSQAPHADWSSPFDEACEEASIIMVDSYYKGEKLNKDTATEKIIDLYNWETENGYKIDIKIEQLKEIAENKYNLKSELIYGDEITINKIKEIISNGKPIIVPSAGRLLGNPNFRGSGPPYHMLVIRGYDEKYFYTNDPGTRKGENYKYEYEILLNSIHNWNTKPEDILEGEKVIMVAGGRFELPTSGL